MSRNRSVRMGLAWVLALASASGAYAIMPAGQHHVDFTGQMRIWDITGSYDEYVADADMSFDLVMDPQGKFTGWGYADIWVEGYYVYLDLSFTGSIKCSSGVTRVTMSMQMTGYVDIYSFSVKGKVAAEVDNASATMYGAVCVSAKVAGYSYSDCGEFSMAFAGGMDGTWSLDTDAGAVDSKTFSGVGWIRLSNGDEYQFTIVGKYDVKTDTSSLTLTSPTRSGSVKLAGVRTYSGGGLGGNISYKLLGQSQKGVF